MNICLAATWNPRGETERLRRLLPAMLSIYDHVRMVLPAHASQDAAQIGLELGALYPQRIALRATANWNQGRYLSLCDALETPCAWVHYADLDRLLRWIETRPDELRHAAQAILPCDCLVMERTPQALATHPQALLRTEAISNQVIGHILGRALDASAGSKGFSRRSAAYLAAHAADIPALGADAGWLILLQRAGFQLDFIQVDGLDWESADRHQHQAAGIPEQTHLAAEYDGNPHNWSARVMVAHEIVQVALETATRPV